jgi:hypothetical protein
LKPAKKRSHSGARVSANLQIWRLSRELPGSARRAVPE